MATQGARRGKFGRLPTVASSISSTLVSIAREMQNAEDTNIMSAWKSGGTWTDPDTGKNIQPTDATVLAYWQKRLKGVDPQDPLFDTYQQNVQQLEYTIAESKMTAAYANGPKDAGADAKMSQFYLNWAKKIPVNSEFYRVLQRDAGQYIQAAKANAKSQASQAAAKAYVNQQNGLQAKYGAAASFLFDVMNQVARGHNLIDLTQDVSSFSPTDPSQMLNILDALNSHNPNQPGTAGSNFVYHDETGKAWSVADIMAHLNTLDPGISKTGALTPALFTTLMDRATAGLQAQIALAQKTGHASDVNKFQTALDNTYEFKKEVNAWPVEQLYTEARNSFLATWSNNPNATPTQKLAAWNQYQQKLLSLSTDPRISTDDSMKQALVDEANGKADAPNLSETFTFLGASQPKDTGETMISLKAYQDESQLVAQSQAEVGANGVTAGTYVWTTGVRDPQTGAFKPSATGTDIGAATVQDVQNQSAGQIAPITIDQGSLGKIILAVPAVPVTMGATDQAGGNIAVDSKTSLGVAYSIPGGPVGVDGKAQNQTMYQFTDQGGITHFTMEPPWAGLSQQVTKNGVVLGFNGQAPQRQPNGQYSFNGVTVGGTPSVGTKGFYVVVGGSQTKPTYTLHLDPATAAASTDPARWSAGGDPSVDFVSPDLARLSAQPDGQQQVAKLSKDPTWMQQQVGYIQTAAAAYAASGAPLAPDGSNPISHQATTQLYGAIGLDNNDRMQDPSMQGLSPLGGQRTTTNGTLPGVNATTLTGTLGMGGQGTPIDTGLLPSQRPGAPQALADNYHPGTNIITSGKGSDQEMGAIALGQLKVPTAPSVNAYTGFAVPTVTPTTASDGPTQTGSLGGTMSGAEQNPGGSLGGTPSGGGGGGGGGSGPKVI